jgi:hypothetical protein
MITIVSGLPRSGTSCLMRCLQLGGMPILSSAERQPDEHNPHGYFEYEPVKRIALDSSWMPLAEGAAVKIVCPLVRDIPEGFEYRVIFMCRDIDEIIESQKAMVGISISKVAVLQYIVEIFKFFERRNIPVLSVQYGDLLRTPEMVEHAVRMFLGIKSFNTAGFIKGIDPSLRHHRRVLAHPESYVNLDTKLDRVYNKIMPKYDDRLMERAKEVYIEYYKRGTPLSFVRFADLSEGILGTHVDAPTIRLWAAKNNWMGAIRTVQMGLSDELRDTFDVIERAYTRLIESDERNCADAAYAFMLLVKSLPGEAKHFVDDKVEDAVKIIMNYLCMTELSNKTFSRLSSTWNALKKLNIINPIASEDISEHIHDADEIIFGRENSGQG